VKRKSLKRISLILVVSLFIALAPVGPVFAEKPTFSNAAVPSTGDKITIPATGAIDLQTIKNRHGWTVKAGTISGTVYKYTTKTIDNVTLTDGTVTIALAPYNFIKAGERVQVTYTKLGDKDKVVRDSSGLAADSVPVSTAIYPTNGSGLNGSAVDWTKTTVISTGVAVKVYFSSSPSPIEYNRMSGYNLTKNHGWTVKKAGVGTRVYQSVRITSIDLGSDNTVTINVYDDTKNKIINTDGVKISYMPPSDVDKKIIGTNKAFLDKITETLITNGSTIEAPHVDWTGASLQADGLTVLVKVYDAVNSYNGLTTGHGWGVKSLNLADPTSIYAIKSIQSVSMYAYTGYSLAAIRLKNTVIIPNGDPIRVSYSIPANISAKIVNSYGNYMPPTGYVNITNGSVCKAPFVNRLYNNTTYHWVYSDKVYLKAYYIDPLISYSTNGWSVRNTSTDGVSVSVYSGTITYDSVKQILTIPLKLPVASTTKVKVTYTKPASGTLVKSTAAEGAIYMSSFTTTDISWKNGVP
jgi:hypothetical protein